MSTTTTNTAAAANTAAATVEQIATNYLSTKIATFKIGSRQQKPDGGRKFCSNISTPKIGSVVNLPRSKKKLISPV